MGFFTKKASPISTEQALSIAHSQCKKHGWPWLEPVEVELSWSNWYISTNVGMIGCNTVFYISKENGKIVKEGFAPR